MRTPISGRLLTLSSAPRPGSTPRPDPSAGSAAGARRERSASVVRLDQEALKARLMISLETATISSFAFFYSGALAASVFPKLFFNRLDPTLGLLESLAVFALACMGGPIRAVWLGHIGDRQGRRPALVVSTLVMGFSSALIGVMPGYSLPGQ